MINAKETSGPITALILHTQFVGDTLKFASPPTPNLKFASSPTPTPYASQWNIGCVGSQRKMLALAMYISCFLCRFHLRLVPNANPISSGIWA